MWLLRSWRAVLLYGTGIMTAAGQSTNVWVHVSGCPPVNVFSTKLHVVLNACAALHVISGAARWELLHTRLRFGEQLVGFMKEPFLVGLYEHIRVVCTRP